MREQSAVIRLLLSTPRKLIKKTRGDPNVEIPCSCGTKGSNGLAIIRFAGEASINELRYA